MKKLNALVALIIVLGQQAHANNCQDEKDEEITDVKLNSSFSRLVKAGAIQISDDQSVIVNPDFVDYLRQSGTILPDHSKAATICVGPLK